MATFTKRIDSGIRDLWDWNDGSWNVDTTLERMGNLGGVISGVSLRFIGVNVGAGATINSAKITFRASNTKSNTNINLIIHGVDEDNTGEFTTSPIDDARTRVHTTANVVWSGAISWTSGSDYDTADITSIIQEIIDRAGWSSGNALAISIQDNGSGTDQYLNNKAYEFDSATAALLTIEFTTGGSASASASASRSLSPSASVSPSRSLSPSASLSPSGSPSISPPPSDVVLKVAKTGINVLTDEDPRNFIFHSHYGTLKYYQKTATSIQIVGTGVGGDFAGTTTISHNLGYYPFAEVFVRVYIGAPAGNYEYVPFAGAGASVFYSANFKLTTTQIVLYAEFIGVSSSTWNFDFLVFIYKNDLGL